MSDPIGVIRRDIDEDLSLRGSDINIEIKKKGVLSRRKYLHVSGSVDKEVSKSKILEIVGYHAGDNFTVVDELTLKTS